MIVGDDAVAFQHLADDSLAVEQIFDRKPEVGVIGRRPVAHHRELAEAWTRGRQDLDARSFLGILDRVRPQIRHHLDIAGKKRVEAGNRIGDAEQLDLVDVGTAGLEVVLVARGDGAHPRPELLDPKWPGTDRGGEVGRAVLQNHEPEGAEEDRDVDVGRLELDANRVLAVSGDCVEVLDEAFRRGSDLLILVPQ